MKRSKMLLVLPVRLKPGAGKLQGCPVAGAMLADLDLAACSFMAEDDVSLLKGRGTEAGGCMLQGAACAGKGAPGRAILVPPAGPAPVPHVSKDVLMVPLSKPAAVAVLRWLGGSGL